MKTLMFRSNAQSDGSRLFRSQYERRYFVKSNRIENTWWRQGQEHISDHKASHALTRMLDELLGWRE